MTSVSLIGFMGCGKSTVGRMLASKIGWGFIDVDTYIQNSVGKTIPEIFQSVGEIGFREHEMRAHKQLADLAQGYNYVISSGGGSVMNSLNMLYLKRSGRIAFLDVPFAICEKRVFEDTTTVRPLAQDPVKFRALYELRRPLYRAYADCVVDSSLSDINATRIEEFLSI